MFERLIAYGIVAAAAGWTLWSLFLKGWVRARGKARNGQGGSDCACGD